MARESIRGPILTAKSANRSLGGICVSPGIGIGRAFVYRKGAPAITRRRVAYHLVEDEVERFLNTLHQLFSGVLISEPARRAIETTDVRIPQ